MKEYHEILTVYKRNPETKFKTLLEGQFATPELGYLADNQWGFTEKIDGMNIRARVGGSLAEGNLFFDFAGKTNNTNIPPFLLKRLHELFSLEKIRAVIPGGDVCLYGEGYGAKIQKGGGNYIPDGQDFILFDVWVGGLWLRSEDVHDVAQKLQIKWVPLLGYGTLYEAVEMARAGFPSRIGTGQAEGVVMRPVADLLDRRGNRIIAKIKHKDFKEALNVA